MSSAMPGATHRKPTRRPGRKAPSLRPDPNTSVTAGVRVVKGKKKVNKNVKGYFIAIFDLVHPYRCS